MSVLKKFLMIICAALMICVAGCGSNKSDKGESTNVASKPSVSSSSKPTYKSKYLGMKPKDFAEDYNDEIPNDAFKIVTVDARDGVCFFKMNLPNHSIGGVTGGNGYLGALSILGTLDQEFLVMINCVGKVLEESKDIEAEWIVENISKGNSIFEDKGVVFNFELHGSEASLIIVDRDYTSDEEKRIQAEEERKRLERQSRLSPYSLGGVNLRMHVDEMRQVIGNEKEIRDSQTTPGNSYYEYNDAVVCMNGGEVISVATYTNAPQTEKGLRQGDPLSKVLSAYGRVCCVTDFEDLTLYEYPFELNGGKFAVMRLAVKNDSVEYISLRLVSNEDFQDISSRRRSIWK